MQYVDVKKHTAVSCVRNVLKVFKNYFRITAPQKGILFYVPLVTILHS
jgi:hypothetical protein